MGTYVSLVHPPISVSFSFLYFFVKKENRTMIKRNINWAGQKQMTIMLPFLQCLSLFFSRSSH